MYNELWQLIDRQDINGLIEFCHMNPLFDLNHVTPTGLSALWLALNPPQGKAIHPEIVKILMRTGRINPLQEWYNTRLSQSYNLKNLVPDMAHYENQHVIPVEVQPEIAAIAAQQQSTHDPLIVKQYDIYIDALYDRYGNNGLMWLDDFDVFVEETNGYKDRSLDRAIQRIKSCKEQRILKPNSEIALTNAQLLMLVWHALCDTNQDHFVDNIDMSLKEQHKRKTILLERILESQHEYRENTPACFMGTRHKIISTLDKVHCDCNETYKALTRELIEEQYKSFCARELDLLQATNLPLYHAFIRSLMPLQQDDEANEKRLNSWINDLKHRFWVTVKQQQKATSTKKQIPTTNFSALERLYLSEDFSISVEQHLPAFMACHFLVNKTLLMNGRFEEECIYPPIDCLLTKEGYQTWLKQNYNQDPKKILAYLSSEQLAAKEPLFKLVIEQLPASEQPHFALQLWKRIITESLTTTEMEEHCTKMLLLEVETRWNSLLGDLEAWVSQLPVKIKYYFFKQLYQCHFSLNTSVRDIAFDIASTYGRWSNFPVNSPLIFEKKDLRGIDLSSLDLTYVTFTDCDLRLTGILSNPTITPQHLTSSQTETNTAFIAASHGYLVPLQVFLSKCDSKEILNAKNEKDETILMSAAIAGHTQAIKAILEKDASPEIVNARREDNYTALILAAEQGHENAVDVILKKNDSLQVINAKDIIFGETALILAARKGHAHVVSTILEKNASLAVINAKDNILGESALITAARKGHSAIVSVILEKNASLDVINTKDNALCETALISAARLGQAATVCAILEKNASQDVINVRNKYGNAAMNARKNHHHPIQSIIQLFQAFNKLDVHAKKLGQPYQENIPPLVQQLKKLTVRYFSENDNQTTIRNEFSQIYATLLPHAKGHRTPWKPILANLLIASTGIGILAIGIAYLTTGHFGLFCQTKREKIACEIKRQLSLATQSANTFIVGT